MSAKRIGAREAVPATVGVVLALLVACSPLETDPVTSTGTGLVGRCKYGTVPCGNGCMPVDAACCDDGTRHTSSYCTNSAGGGCRPNANQCTTPSPGQPAAAFCCASNTQEGSFDCPDGQHHCGLACVPIGQACCAADALASDCPYAADSDCPAVDGVRCGVKAGTCRTCPMGSCCASDRLDSFGFRCLPPTGVCTGRKAGGSSGSSSGSSGGGNCKLVWDCGSSSQCAQVYGAKSGSAAEPDATTCAAVCKAQGACTCQGC